MVNFQDALKHILLKPEHRFYQKHKFGEYHIDLSFLQYIFYSTLLIEKVLQNS